MKLRVIILLAIAGWRPATAIRATRRRPRPSRRPGLQAAAPTQGPNPQQSTADMVEAVAQGKAQAPIELKFDLLAATRRRDSRSRSRLRSCRRSPPARPRVAVTGSDGLKIDSGETQFEFPAIEAAQVYRHSIKVTPTAEGFYLLTLSVSLQHDQTSDSRVFSVPILVGTPAPRLAPPAEHRRRRPAAHRGS